MHIFLNLHAKIACEEQMSLSNMPVLCHHQSAKVIQKNLSQPLFHLHPDIMNGQVQEAMHQHAQIAAQWAPGP